MEISWVTMAMPSIEREENPLLPTVNINAVDLKLNAPDHALEILHSENRGIIPKDRAKLGWDSTDYFVMADRLDEADLPQGAYYFRVVGQAKAEQELEFQKSFLETFKPYWPYKSKRKCHFCQKPRALNWWNVCRKCHTARQQENSVSDGTDVVISSSEAASAAR